MYRLTSNNVQPTRSPGQEVGKVWGHTGPGAGSGHRRRAGANTETRRILKFSFFLDGNFEWNRPEDTTEGCASPAEFWGANDNRLVFFLFPVEMDNFRPWRKGRGGEEMLVYHSVFNSGFSHWNFYLLRGKEAL